MTSKETPQARSRQAARAAQAHRAIPWPLGIPALLAALFLLVPLAGLLVRAPWRGLPSILADSEILDALRLSLVCASAATALSLVCGVPLAWVLARSNMRGLSGVMATMPALLGFQNDPQATHFRTQGVVEALVVGMTDWSAGTTDTETQLKHAI